MATSMRSVASRGAVVKSQARPAVVTKATGEKAQIAAVALAAAAIIAAPAHAGVVFQEQPNLKKVFQSDETPAPVRDRPFRLPGSAPAPAASAPSVAAAPKPKVQETSSSEGLDPRAIALPASIVAIAGLGIAASKVDEGFNEWITESGALVKSNMKLGVGYEEEIKGGNLSTAPAAGSRKIKAGTAKVKKGTTTTKGTSFFGKK